MKKKYISRAFAIALPASLLALGANAQMVNDGAKLQVNAGTFLIVDNLGFQNNAGGQVTNAGEIHVDGDWTNNEPTGVFGAAPTAVTGGTVRLTGGAQNLAGTNATNFFDLSSEGTAGSIKTLTADQNIFGTVTINNSKVALNTNTMTVENSAATAVATVGSGFLISEAESSILRWRIPNATTGNYLIPWGTTTGATVSIPFRYNKTAGGTISGGGPGDYTDFATYGTGSLNTPYPTDVTHLTDDYQQTSHFWVMDRYWFIENNFQGNYSAYPAISYTFGYDDVNEMAAPNHMTEANIVAQRFNSVDDVWLDWLYSPTANTGANTVTVNLANFHDYHKVWTLVDQSDPLPIELAYFEAKCENGTVNVTWTTWTETNTSYFTVQHSSDGVNFETVGEQQAAGNSNSAKEYAMRDENSLEGTSYYRLVTTDLDGKLSYSQIVAVSCEDYGTEFDLISAYDVDNENIAIEFTANENEVYTMRLMDAGGKLVMDRQGQANSGFNRMVIPTGNLATGVYVVNLSNASKSLAKRVALH
jgi:hypothetical protein